MSQTQDCSMLPSHLLAEHYRGPWGSSGSARRLLHPPEAVVFNLFHRPLGGCRPSKVSAKDDFDQWKVRDCPHLKFQVSKGVSTFIQNCLGVCKWEKRLNTTSLNNSWDQVGSSCKSWFGWFSPGSCPVLILRRYMPCSKHSLLSCHTQGLQFWG